MIWTLFLSSCGNHIPCVCSSFKRRKKFAKISPVINNSLYLWYGLCVWYDLHTHINTHWTEKEIGVELFLVKFHFLREIAYFSTSKKYTWRDIYTWDHLWVCWSDRKLRIHCLSVLFPSTYQHLLLRFLWESSVFFLMESSLSSQISHSGWRDAVLLRLIKSLSAPVTEASLGNLK